MIKTSYWRHQLTVVPWKQLDYNVETCIFRVNILILRYRTEKLWRLTNDPYQKVENMVSSKLGMDLLQWKWFVYYTDSTHQFVCSTGLLCSSSLQRNTGQYTSTKARRTVWSCFCVDNVFAKQCLQSCKLYLMYEVNLLYWKGWSWWWTSWWVEFVTHVHVCRRFWWTCVFVFFMCLQCAWLCV